VRAREKDAENDEDAQRLAQAQKIREKPVERNPLSRDHSRKVAGDVDYMKMVGKSKSISAKEAAKDRVGAFYCPLTGKTFSDNITYLDHINGKKYQKELGMKMRVERSTTSDVKSLLKRKKVEADEEKAAAAQGDTFVGLDARMARAREDEEARKKQRKDYREDKKKREQEKLQQEQMEGVDPMMAMMGLPMGFK